MSSHHEPRPMKPNDPLSKSLQASITAAGLTRETPDESDLYSHESPLWIKVNTLVSQLWRHGYDIVKREEP